MKKVTALVASALIVAAGSAFAAEFQPIGALGMGGAGVARNYGAYAAYWNPAGLAFRENTVSTRINVGVGLGINSSMADNVDKIGKLDIGEMKNLNITNQNDVAGNLQLLGKATEFVGIVNDLEHNNGTLSVTADGVFGIQVMQFGTGAFATAELGAFPRPDLNAVSFGGVSLAQLPAAIGAGSASPGNFFTPSQRAEIATAFGSNNGTGIANAFDKYYSENAPKTQQTNAQLKDALVHIGNSMTMSGSGSLEDNKTTLEYIGLGLLEFPIAYGHKFDFERYGKLAVGGAFKIMTGRVYIGESQLSKIKDSGDIVKNIRDTYNDSTTVGLDLGLLWRYNDWVNVGLTAKNLNSPSFDSPVINSVNNGGSYKKSVKVKPQVRTGAAVDLLSWITFAADLDLTENETILGKGSRNLGAGVDIHPLSWFKARIGLYDNLASSDVGPVATGGLTLGIPWVNFDIDGAAALKSGKYNGTEYPQELRVQFAFNFLF